MATNDGGGGGATARVARYKECLRNHAIRIGGYVVDGCGEFLKSGEDGTPQALLCAACGCHRNFHRKVEPPVQPCSQFTRIHLHHHRYPHPAAAAAAAPPPPPLREVVLALPAFVDRPPPADVQSDQELRLKRKARTSLMPAQKEQMRAFAERLGWKPQKQDEDEIEKFCSELGISTQVFRVWIKNNRRRWMGTTTTGQSSSTPTTRV